MAVETATNGRIRTSGSRPRGSGGQEYFRGYVGEYEEFNRRLFGERGLRVYDEMRRTDGQMARVSCRCANYRYAAPRGKSKARMKMSRSFWRPTLACRNPSAETESTSPSCSGRPLRALSLDLPFSRKRFVIMGGMAYLKNVAFRPQQTIYRFNSKDDMLAGVTQNAAGRFVEIPGNAVMHIAREQEGTNWSGISMLRSAYPHWWIKQQLYKIDAIAHQRFGIGIPIARPTDKDQFHPPGQEGSTGDPAGSVRRQGELHPGGWFCLPDSCRPRGTPPAPATIQAGVLSTTIHRSRRRRWLFSCNWELRRPDQQGDVSVTFADIFFNSLQALADEIAEVYNRDLIRPLLAYNFGAGVEARLTWADIRLHDISTLAKFLQSLSALAALSMPDEGIEGRLREISNLPPKMEEGSPPAPEPEPEPAMDPMPDTD